MMLSKCFTQYVSKSGRPSCGHRTGNDQSSSQFPKRVVFKNVLTIRQLHSSPMLVKKERKKVKSLSRVWLFATPWTGAYQAPPSMGFSRQKYWSGLPFPPPMHESEKWKWSHWVVSNSLQPHGLEPTRLLHPWDFPGKGTGVGCLCLFCDKPRQHI